MGDMMASADVVILLPGISGSTLSKDGKVIWGASLGSIFRAISSGGDAIRALALSHGDDPDLDDIDGIEATSLIPDLHLIPGLWKIDGYTKVREQLLSRLRLKPGENFFEFPYDWRRDNRVAARKLAAFARAKLKRWRETSGAGTAKLVLVTHSMGGLVARAFIDGHEGWRDTRALITLGTPHRGSLNALGYLANGFAKGIGPIKFDLSDVARTFTALYQLLPAYPCVDAGNGDLSRVKDVNGLPNIDRARAESAAAFYETLETQHTENMKLEEYQASAPRWFPVIGDFQPTMLSARLDGDRLTLLKTLRGKDDSGDGTVPKGSAMPIHLAQSSAGMYAQQVHGSLQNDKAVLDQVVGVIEGLRIDPGAYRAGAIKVGLDLDDAYPAGEPVALRARTSERVAALTADIYDAQVPAGRDAPRLKQVVLRDDGQGELAADTVLPEGAYRVTVGGAGNIAAATDCFLVVAQGG